MSLARQVCKLGKLQCQLMYNQAWHGTPKRLVTSGCMTTAAIRFSLWDVAMPTEPADVHGRTS